MQFMEFNAVHGTIAPGTTGSGYFAGARDPANALKLKRQYEKRFGPLVGNGYLQGLLGDPSKFDFGIAGGCHFFIPGVDSFGNPWLVLIKQADGTEIYDWEKLVRRKVEAWADAKRLFESIESQTIAVSGGIGRGDAFPYDAYLSDPQRLDLAIGHQEFYVTPKGKTAIGSPSFIPEDTNVLRSDATYLRAQYSRYQNPTDFYLQRIVTPVSIEGGPFIITGNPILRIGYITGFQGMVSTDPAGYAIFKTILDLCLIIADIITGNYIGALAAAYDIIKSWVSYAEGEAAKDALGRMAGLILQRDATALCSVGTVENTFLQNLKYWLQDIERKVGIGG